MWIFFTNDSNPGTKRCAGFEAPHAENVLRQSVSSMCQGGKALTIHTNFKYFVG